MLDTPSLYNLIPRPAAIAPADGAFNLTADTMITVAPATAEMARLGAMLAHALRPAGKNPPGRTPLATPSPGNIQLSIAGGDPVLGEEGYELTVATTGITLSAYRPAGIFYGLQTIRQLLPADIGLETSRPGPWAIAAGTIRDMPRFPWRGTMLDVARHFFPVEDVKATIDLLAAYKLNRLHLHLSDDQGWRIEIRAWPNLTKHGGSTAVGGGPGGYYTQAQYAEIVRYAEDRCIIVVPEIEMPSHTNAALASYPKLNASGVAPALYTGTEVGFSSLCANKEITYAFLEDVIGEIAALTPGPYFHIGGDEAWSTPKQDAITLVERAQEIVGRHGKQMVGWEEIAAARLAPSTIAQFWNTRSQDPSLACAAAAQGVKVILSPASRAYLDMQYDPSTPLGLNWAGYVEVRDAYEWEPATIVPGLPPENILGVESALWTETVETRADIEFLTFPRLAGCAEIGWSPSSGRSWEEYRQRLAAHGIRWQAQKVNFYRSPQVAWAT